MAKPIAFYIGIYMGKTADHIPFSRNKRLQWAFTLSIHSVGLISCLAAQKILRNPHPDTLDCNF